MRNRLKEVLAIQSESYDQTLMYEYIIKRLKALNVDWYDDNGNIYATKGIADSYPCMVSHMDTVHYITDDLTVIDIDGKLTGFNKVTMKQTGIGGDDKVGVYIALEVLDRFDICKAVFFRDEEVGCHGSYSPDLKWFNNVNFALQCDRKSYGDFITTAGGTKLSGKDFQADLLPILERYKFKFESGMMTDVMALKESGVECAMANMSCGYYNPHCSYEWVSVSAVKWTLQMVVEIITTFGDKKYTCKPVKKTATYYTKPYSKSYKTYDDYYDAKTGKYKGGKIDWDALDEKNWKLRHDSLGTRDFTNEEDEKDYCGCCGDLKPLKYVRAWQSSLCDECRKEYDTDSMEKYYDKEDCAD